MDTMKVWPRLMDDGTSAHVRMPERNWAPLPVEGATVPVNEFWTRRLRDGDALDHDPRPPVPDAPPDDGEASASVSPTPPAEPEPGEPTN